MKKLLLPLLLAVTILANGQTNIDQLIEAPGGGYIIFTDWGADYPLPGIQEYHKWSDLHLIDTFAVYSDSICISLFMDSTEMNCIQIPGIAGICLDTFYVNDGDSLILVECDNDTTFFAGGGTGDADWYETGTTIPPDSETDSQWHEGKVAIGADGPYDGTLNIINDSQTPPIDINQIGDAPILRSRVLASPEYSWALWYGDDGSFYIINKNSASGAVTKRPFLIEQSTSSTPDNQLYLQADGDIMIPDYPNTRDDGTPVNVMGTDIDGVLQSYPVGDLPDPSAVNEAWTISDGTNTELITTQTVEFIGINGLVTNYSVGSNTMEFDPSNVGNQYLYHSSDATTHTTGLTDGSGDPGHGTLTLAEGTGVTLTTSGAGTDQTVTIATTITDTDTDDQGLTITGSGPTYTVDIDNGSDVIIAGAGGITLSEGTPNTLTITQTADGDGSSTNELQTLDASGTGPTITLDLSSDASDITVVGSGATAITATGNAITIGTSTEAIQDAVGPMVDPGNTETGITVTYDDAGNMFDFVATDASTTNEIQTLTAGGAGPTSYTLDLSLSGGSVTLLEGTGMNLTRSTNTITLNSIEDQALGFISDAPNVDMFIDDGNTMTFIAGTNITLSNTGTTMTINSSSGSSDADWLEESLGTPPNAVNDHMYTGTGDHGFGTTTPDKQVDIANTAATGPWFQMDYTTGTDNAGIMGTQSFAYANEDLVKVVAQKQTNNSNNDTEFRIQLKDDAGAMSTGFQLDYEAGTAVDKPRIQTFGGHQNQNWVNIAVTTQLDESHYGVRATASSITLTLPSLTITNTEGIGTELIIYNTSAGTITIDPGSNVAGNVDTLNGSTANTTLATKESKHYLCTYIDASGAQDWISID